MFEYTNWLPNEPNSHGGEVEQCLEWHVGEGWNDVPCYLPFRYICEHVSDTDITQNDYTDYMAAASMNVDYLQGQGISLGQDNIGQGQDNLGQGQDNLGQIETNDIPGSNWSVNARPHSGSKDQFQPGQGQRKGHQVQPAQGQGQTQKKGALAAKHQQASHMTHTLGEQVVGTPSRTTATPPGVFTQVTSRQVTKPSARRKHVTL